MNNRFSKIAVAAAAALVIGGGLTLVQRPVHAASDGNIEAMSKIGLDIAPVKLTFANRDKKQVGYGSYLVNAVAGCNDCHSAGPQTQYAPGNNPYFGQKPTVTNPIGYLGGGRDFGQFPADVPLFPHIVSRNLTPNGQGQVVGGLAEFKNTLRTGQDPDSVHLNCGPSGPDGKCMPPPFLGSLLQIMPWPIYQNMTDFDMEAIYAYLSSIPCVVGPNDSATRCNK